VDTGSSGIARVIGTLVIVSTVLGGVDALASVSVTGVNRAGIVVVTVAGAAGTVSLADSAAISNGAEELDGGIDLEVRSGRVSLGEEDVKVVVLADSQTQGFQVNGGILGSVDTSQVND